MAFCLVERRASIPYCWSFVGMSEPHLHLFDKLTIFPKLVLMNNLLDWMKEVKFGWLNLDFVVDGQNSPIQFCDSFFCWQTGLQPCILYKRRTCCIFCYTLNLLNTPVESLKGSNLSPNWVLFLFFHNFDQNDPIYAPEDFLITFPAMEAVWKLLLWHCSAIPFHETLFHFWLKAVNSFSSPITVRERKSSPSVSYQASISAALLFSATSVLILAILE